MSYGYLAQMLDYLPSAYTRADIRNSKRDLPLETNIGRLFGTFAWGLEIIQEHGDRIRLWDDLDNAQGVVLDRYGANFGVQRGGASDVLYRLLIKVKMIALLSGGDINTIIQAAANLFDVQFTDIELQEVFPAKVWLYVDEAILDEERLEAAPLIADLMKRIAAAGVGVYISLRTYRTYRMTLSISRGAAVGTKFTMLPTGNDRYLKTPVFVASMGFMPPTITGTPSDVYAAREGCQDVTGGVFCCTHIKPKRID